MLFFVADKAKLVNAVLGALRLHLGEKLGLIRKGEWQFLWVTDFPLFENDDDRRGRRRAPPVHLAARRGRGPARDRARARCSRAPTTSCSTATRSAAARSVSTAARCRRACSGRSASPTRTRSAKFGFLLDAFKYGPPPHGGIAFGVDRLAMLLSGAESLRDVIAFPKTQKGTDLMTERPTPVSKKQLDELFIQVKPGPAERSSR